MKANQNTCVYNLHHSVSYNLDSILKVIVSEFSLKLQKEKLNHDRLVKTTVCNRTPSTEVQSVK